MEAPYVNNIIHAIYLSVFQAWKRHNETLQEMASASQKQLAALKKDVQEVNWARKNQQTNVGEKLRQLEVNYINYFIIIRVTSQTCQKSMTNKL